MLTIIPNLNNVKSLNRTYADNNGIRLIMSASGLEFHFKGHSLSFLLEGDDATSIKGNYANYPRYEIYIDDAPLYRAQLTTPAEEIVVFPESDTEHDCVVKLLKLSEAPMSTLLVSGIRMDDTASIEPTAGKERRIEFIGDSITCGYGIEDEDELHHFSTATEDVTKAYAYRTIKALDADYCIVSYSGYGIISGYTGDGTRNESELLPPLYEGMGRCYAAPSFASVPWDFSRFTPDTVVINLGTNDQSYCLFKEDRMAEHCALYIDFLKLVRSHYSLAHIVCVLGLMGDELLPNIKKAVTAYSEETGDCNISVFRLTPQQPENGLVADFHPTVLSHRIAALELTELLRSLK